MPPDVFRVLKMDARVPVDGRVFMRKRALRNCLADKQAYEGGEARRSAVNAKACQGAGWANSGGNRATRVPPQGGKKKCVSIS